MAEPVRRRRRASIRFRITAVATLVTLVVVVLAAVAVVLVQRELLLDDLAVGDGGGREEVDEETAELARTLAQIIPVVVVVLAGAVWWLTGRTLRPVEAIRAEVAAIGESDLHRRVPEPGTGDEIDRLASTMNEMIARLESARRRQQRFVADASHELRSPLTRMRAELEVDRAHPATADLRASHESVLQEIVNLQGLIDDLLVLARHDDDHRPADRTIVDLDDLLLDEVRRVRQLGAATVDTSGVSAAQVLGDRRQLARVVRNLADNAVRHAVSRVVVTLAERDGDAVLTVADDGPGIPPGEAERIFERFARLDEARNVDDGGSGLGLAITREIVSGHGGRVGLDATVTAGACFVVELPLAGTAGGEAPARRRT